jgi:ATP-binding cassette, subfamily B, bacterial MsbA
MTQPSGFTLRLLLGRYARPHSGVIVLMVALTLLANLLTVLQPAILAALLSNLSGSVQEPVPPGTPWLDLNHLGVRVSAWFSGGTLDILTWFGILFVSVAILVSAVNYAAESAAAWLRVQVGRSIQLDLVQHLLTQDMAFFSRQKSGELISRVTFDASATALGVGPLVRSVMHHSVQVAVYSAYLLSTSVWLTVGAVALIGAQFGLTQVLKKPIRRLVRADTDASAGMLSALQEALTSIRVAKSFGAEAYEADKLRTSADSVVRSLWRKSRIEKLEAPMRSVLDAFAVCGIFLLAIGQMRSGLLTFDGLILFTFVGRFLIAPIGHLATTALSFESVRAASSRIDELMKERPAVVDGALSKTTFERSLSIRNCSFSYGAQPAIDQVTLDIRKGEFVALVGPSGAGKSTLTDLILRLYDPDAGEILIDGVDLRELRQRDYRQMFGVVSQESLLFHDTVGSNIRYGRGHVSDAMIEQAARVANAHGFITALPNGYDTVVGDRGLRLSGGERQRISIARAVVDNPEILILDEATSALDSESEHLVQQAINQVVERTTAVVVAHRLSTVMHADRIVLLNSGRVESAGRHDELLKTSQTYRQLCQLQFDQPLDRATLR